MFRKLWAYLSDFSAADRERQAHHEALETILGAALRESRADAEFSAKLRETVEAWWTGAPPLTVEREHLAWLAFIAENRRVGDTNAGLRTQAEHLLEDLPRILGVGGGAKGVPGAPERGGR